MTTITDKLAQKARAVTAYGDERTLRIAIDELRATLAEYNAQRAQSDSTDNDFEEECAALKALDNASPSTTFAQRCHDFADELQERAGMLRDRRDNDGLRAARDLMRACDAVRTIGDNAECDPQDYGNAS